MGDDSKPGPDPTVSDEEILSVFIDASDPVLTATEAAEQLPITRRGLYNRLVTLEKDEQIRSKKVGGRTTVWWVPGQTSTR